MLLTLVLSTVLGPQSFSLTNPDFEVASPTGELPAGWTLEVGATNDGQEPSSTVALDTQVAHGGKASVRFSGDQSTRGWYALKQEVPVRPEGLYTLKAFARADGVRRETVRGTTVQQFENCYVGIVFFDWSGEMIAETHLAPKLPKSDWEELSMYQVAPPQTRRVQVAIFLSMSGTLWVDDLEFSLEGGKEPPETKVLMKEGFETSDALPAEWGREVGARTGSGATVSLISIDPNEDAGGSPRALKFSGDASTDQWLGISRRFDCAPGDALRYRSLVKAKDVRKDGTQPQNFYTGLVFIGANGKLVGAKRYAHGSLGSFDWQPFEVTGVAPEGAVAVMAGIFLSMSGEVWFDRLELTSQPGATPAYAGWETLETDHVTVRSPPDHPEKGRLEHYGTRLDAAFETIHKRLGLAYGERLTVYIYTDNEQGRKLTSHELDFSNPQARVVHQRYESMPGHEMTHVIAFALGLPGSELLNEGLAVYCDGTPAKEVHRKAAQYLRAKTLPAVSSLVDHFHASPEITVAAGSFVGYAMETLGLDRFKHLYLLPNPGTNAESVAPGGLPGLEKAWHEFLKQQS